jgi:hypothetical protein
MIYIDVGTYLGVNNEYGSEVGYALGTAGKT